MPNGSACRVELITFDAAGKVFEALKRGVWDIAFLAVEPVRAAEIDFTAPYVLIEGTYMVPKDSALKKIEDVDKAGVRIAVATGSAYDLYLTRTIKNATLVRAPTGPEAMAMFVRDKLEAVRRGEAAAGRVRRGQSEPAGDGRPLHGDPAGHGHAEGPQQGARVSA